MIWQISHVRFFSDYVRTAKLQMNLTETMSPAEKSISSGASHLFRKPIYSCFYHSRHRVLKNMTSSVKRMLS